MTEQQATPMHGSRCVWTSKAIDAMKGGKPGDKITREQMTAILGRDCSVGQRGYGNVQSAINHVESTYSVAWKWSREQQAWICLDSSGKAIEAKHRGDSGARKIRRGLRIAATVDRSALGKDELATLDRTVIQLEMARVSMSSPMTKRIESSGAVKPPDLDAMAKLMQSK